MKLVGITSLAYDSVRGEVLYNILIEFKVPMNEILEVRCLDGIRCHDVRTKFHEDGFRYSEVSRGTGVHRYTTCGPFRPT
jgi:hypothetical protein